MQTRVISSEIETLERGRRGASSSSGNTDPGGAGPGRNGRVRADLTVSTGCWTAGAGRPSRAREVRPWPAVFPEPTRTGTSTVVRTGLPDGWERGRSRNVTLCRKGRGKSEIGSQRGSLQSVRGPSGYASTESRSCVRVTGSCPELWKRFVLVSFRSAFGVLRRLPTRGTPRESCSVSDAAASSARGFRSDGSARA